MYVFVYQGAFICEDCEPKVQTAILMRGLERAGGWATFVRPEEREYSECFPQGPFPDGGGEADYPQHCDCCGVFLKNPLTSDGQEWLAMTRASGRISPPDWEDFYRA